MSNKENIRSEQKKLNFKLSQRLLAYFILISLIPLIIMAYISININKTALEKKTEAHLSDLARDCGRKISFFLDHQYQDIIVLSQINEFKDKDNTVKQSIIEKINEINPFYETIMILDKNGEITECTNKELIGDSRFETDWFQKTIIAEQEQVIQIDFYQAESTNLHNVIGFNIPIYDDLEKEIVAVLSTRINIHHIESRVEVIKKVEGQSKAYLLNNSMIMLVGPDEDDTLKPYPYLDSVVVEELRAGKTGITKYSVIDENNVSIPVISAYYFFKGEEYFDGWGWSLIITEKQDDMFSSVIEIRNTAILLLFCIGIFSIIFSIFISRIISRPILEIANTARNIVKTGLGNKKIVYKRKDEIGDLVFALNSMMDNLNKTMTSRDLLVNEVRERKKTQEELKKSHEKLRNLAIHLQSIREEERINMAREIHDELGQLLTALKMDIYWLYNKIPDDSKKIAEKKKLMLDIINSTIQSVQRITRELRPGLLDDLSLSAAIDWEINEFRKRTGIECEVLLIPEEIIINNKYSLVVYRILQEALTNIIRHSKATKVNIILKKQNNRVALIVRDNGKGISEEELSNPKAFGIIGMRERCLALGGEIKFTGSKGSGTEVIANFNIKS